MKKIIVIALSLAFVGCSQSNKKMGVENEPAYYAKARIIQFKGKKTVGEISFHEAFGSIKYKVSLRKLPKNKKLALIFHSNGHCFAGPKGAGPMFLMEKRKAIPYVVKFESDTKGEFSQEGSLQNFSLNASNAPVVGRSVVLHSDLNDFTGQYSGKFENRVACGIIGVSNK